MTLASSDPFAKPVINPNYLTSDFDVFTMIQAIKDMKTFVSADPWKDIIIGPVGQLSTATTDEQLALYARNGSISINHSIGTARMSPFSAKWGVVDPDLAVKGARGLSVVDASVFVCFVFRSSARGVLTSRTSLRYLSVICRHLLILSRSEL